MTGSQSSFNSSARDRAQVGSNRGSLPTLKIAAERGRRHNVGSGNRGDLRTKLNQRYDLIVFLGIPKHMSCSNFNLFLQFDDGFNAERIGYPSSGVQDFK
jgi:hypothetical protein